MDAKAHADLEQLVTEGLAGLREHPAPLLVERFACMLGVPPSLASATSTETAALIAALEADGSGEALAVLRALDRIMVAGWARAAGAAAGRLESSGVEPAAPAGELRLLAGVSGQLGALGVLAVRVEASGGGFVGTLIAQRTDDGSAHLDGGLGAALTPEEADARFAALRAELEDIVELDPSTARKDAARFFAWARELPAPTTQGLELERPLLALALSRRRDPWPELNVVSDAQAQRLRASA